MRKDAGTNVRRRAISTTGRRKSMNSTSLLLIEKFLIGYFRKSKYIKRGIYLLPTKFGIAFGLKHMNQVRNIA